MTPYDQFLALVDDLLDRVPSRESVQTRSAMLRPEDLHLLRFGLTLTLVNGVAFDQFLELALHRSLCRPGVVATLTERTEQQVLEGGIECLTPDELIELATDSHAVTRLYEALANPTAGWEGRSRQLHDVRDGSDIPVTDFLEKPRAISDQPPTPDPANDESVETEDAAPDDTFRPCVAEPRDAIVEHAPTEPVRPAFERANQAWRYLRAVAAALLLALAAVAGYCVRMAREPPPTGVPTPETVDKPGEPQDDHGAVNLTCQFKLYRRGPDGDQEVGVPGVTPVVACNGDVLVLDLRMSRPALPVVLARRPDGTRVQLLPASGEENPQPTESALVRFTIDQPGEWLVVVVGAAPTRYRELLATPALLASGFETEPALDYTAGRVTAAGEVRGSSLPAAVQAVRDQFSLLCKQLAQRGGGQVRAVVLPVSPAR